MDRYFRGHTSNMLWLSGVFIFAIFKFFITHTHTHIQPFTAPWTLSSTTRVSRYQKDKTRKVKSIWIYWSKR